MKRIVRIGVVLIAAIAILGFVSCGSSSKSTPTGSSDATLTSVKFGNEVATLGTPAATYGQAVAGSVVILQSSTNVTAVPSNSKATLEYAKATASAPTEEYWSDTTFEFATGDYLAIKVTAEDNKTIRYYKIGVTLADVALSTLSVGGVDVTLGTPGSTWQTAGGSAYVLFDYLVDAQPDAGLAIVATAAEGATITYGHAVGTNAPTFNDVSTIKFVDGEYLYIKVTGTSGSAVYKIQVNFKQQGKIKYGKPKIGYGTNPDSLDLGVDGVLADGVGYIDPAWDDPELDTYNIAKVYANDSGSYLAAPDEFPQTTATAKVMWDEEGLSVYVKVIDGDVSAVDAEHETDSFELFVNEDITFNGSGSQMYSNGGSQYRVASAGKRSGEGQSPAAMSALNKTTAWHTDDGYIVIMKAPWRLRNKFFASDTYRNGWKFGFELQINAAPTTGNRYAVLVWNNVAHTNYQNAADYGVAELTGQSGPLNYPALSPVIETQPQGVVVSGGVTSVELSVTASTKDAGILSYQWYSAATATAAGTLINGATGEDYNITTLPEETTYYYVVVTNTLSGTTASTTSARARVTIPTVPQLDKFSLMQTMPVYKFALPTGAKFEDYYGISVKVKVDDANLAKKARSLRLMGNYKESDFSVSDAEGGYNFFSFDGANAAYIYDDTGVGNGTVLSAISNAQVNENQTIEADTWFTITYKLVGNNPNTSFVNRPADDATGPFLFGVGIPGVKDNGGTEEGPIEQYLKEIIMLHKTDATKNVITTDFYGFVGYGSSASPPDGGFSMSQIPDPDYITGSETFFLNLSNVKGGSSGTDNLGPYATGTVTNGVLTLTFDTTPLANNSLRGVIGFTDDQILKIKGATSVIVNIDGSATPDVNFRYHIGDASLGASWNNTGAIGGDVAFSTIVGPQTLTLDKSSDEKLALIKDLILNQRTGTDAGAVLTIKSITITTVP